MAKFFDQLDEKRKYYIENVLPHLIPNVPQDLMGSTGSGPGKFSIGIEADAFQGTHYEPTSNRFVHFTSLRAFQSIVNDNAIRLYDLHNMNDPNELGFYTADLDLGKSIEHLKSTTFILSLCDAKVLKGENILNLWRFYGDEGKGVAIEFEIEMPHSSLRKYFLGKIFYEKPIIDNFKDQNAVFEKRYSVKVDFTGIVRISACFHKSPYYSMEEETRLMLVEEGAEQKAKHDFTQNKFRRDYNSRNELVTYHRFNFDQKHTHHSPKITIKRIELGFRHTQASFSDFKNHLINTFVAKSKASIWKGDLPIIELSPLLNIYR